MERWLNKIAVVTGANSGIGAAISSDLIRAGLIVIGLDLNCDNLEKLKLNVKNEKGTLHYRKCDVSKNECVQDVFRWIETEFYGVNILINCAGIIRRTKILDENSTQHLIDIINVNLMGTIFTSKAAYEILKKTQDFGHIVNINSIYGHVVQHNQHTTTSNVYAASKHGITALSEILRIELNSFENRKIKITSISPGLIKTNIMVAGNYPKAKEIYETMPFLNPEDVSQGIMYALSTAPHIQIKELIINAVGSHD